MIDVVESGYEKMSIGISNLTEVMRNGVAIARRQLEITEKRLSILEKSKPQHYNEANVWQELDNIRVSQQLQVKCYCFLCENEHAKRQFFRVPREMHWELLYQLMNEAGLL